VQELIALAGGAHRGQLPAMMAFHDVCRMIPRVGPA
jgi:hypothetical protein